MMGQGDSTTANNTTTNKLRPTASSSGKTDSVFSTIDIPPRQDDIDRPPPLLAFPQIGSRRQQQQINNLPESQEWEPNRSSQLLREEQRLLHPIHSVRRSGTKPHNKLVGNGADSDDDFIPATSKAQATTISHISTPSNFIESSHTTQQHGMPAEVRWKKLLRGAGVLAS
jgi:hypothetical protein